jgi:hypothetical protein
LALSTDAHTKSGLLGSPGCIEGVANVAVDLHDDFSVPFQNPKLKGTVGGRGSHAQSISQ